MRKYVEHAEANEQINLISSLLAKGSSDQVVADHLMALCLPNLRAADGAWTAEDVRKIRIDFALMPTQEKVYFDKAGIKVTNDLFTTDLKIYNVRDIVAVETVKRRYCFRRKDRPGEVYPVWGFVVMTPIYGLMGAAGLVVGLLSGTLSFLAVGVLASIAFVMCLKTTLKGLNWTHYVRLTTRHGQQAWAFDSTDEQLVNSVVDAVQQAIKEAAA